MSTKSQHRFSVLIQGGKDSVIMDNNDIYQVRIHEDIYSYSKSVQVICKDSRALHEMLPLIGNEKVLITYSSLLDSGESYIDKEFSFNIMKINVENTEDRNRHAIELVGIDENYKKLHTYHFTRSFSDACYTYGDIAKYILEIMAEVKLKEFENCPEFLKYFHTGLKTPAQCVKWLLSRCTSLVTGVPGYVMYSDTKDSGDDSMRFISLETLLQKGVDVIPPSDGMYTVRSHNEYNINDIKGYKINRPDKMQMRNLIGGYTLCWDINRKKYIKVDLNYLDALEKFTCLGSKSLFNTAAIDIDIGEFKKHININENNEEILKNIYFSDWVLRYCLQQTVQCVIEGHASRFAGGMIEIKWPSADDDIQADHNMIGLFLIKSITHQFMPAGKPTYQQKMVLIKNGYHESDPNLIDAVKINTKFTEISGGGGGLPQ